MRLLKNAPGVAPDLPSAALSPGRVVPGSRYRVMAKIGEGAMGEVYLAEHVDLEKRVALKLLNASYARLPDAVERFRQEARAASSIGSPYICDVTDFGHTPDGRVFFVMEYLEGQSLRRVLGTQGTIAASRAIGILRQVCKALGAAHEKGIIHLDVKPDNIMVRELRSRPDAVKVVDFGIAGLTHNQERKDTISGTPDYIAPERALGRGYDHRSDIYSLGVMAYELLTGGVPFHDPDVTGLMKLHVTAAPQPLRQRAPDKGIPAELETVVMQMLQKDPQGRPQSMADIEAMLCEAQIAAAITTPWDDLELPHVDEQWRTRLGDRMPSPRGRQRRAVALAASTVALVAVAVAFYFGVIKEPEVRVVQVTVTKTDEAPSVAEWIIKAEHAGNSRRYTIPAGDSALFYIDAAETEAQRVSHKPSPGAKVLRRTYANALALAGDDLLKADLRDLAIAKFKEALLFQGDDPELQAKADLTPDERKAYGERARVRPGKRPAALRVLSHEEEATMVAGNAFILASKGNLSEARLATINLAKTDTNGVQAAKLADALRRLARSAWSTGNEREARDYYAMVLELDSNDVEAKERVISPGAAPQPNLRTAATGTDAAAKGRPDADAVRETVASQNAAAAGLSALARGKLGEAESAFNRAIRLDAMNAAGVGGLAEVAFERGRYAEALDYGRHATKLAPRSARYLMVVGDALFKLLRYKDAATAYTRAKNLSPGDERIKGRLDRVRAKLDKP